MLERHKQSESALQRLQIEHFNRTVRRDIGRS